MMESARHTVVNSSSDVRSSASRIYSMERRTDSIELLRQLSDVVDGLVSLSTPPKDLSVNTSNGCARTLLDHAQKLLSVTGTCREIPERALLSR